MFSERHHAGIQNVTGYGISASKEVEGRAAVSTVGNLDPLALARNVLAQNRGAIPSGEEVSESPLHFSDAELLESRERLESLNITIGIEPGGMIRVICRESEAIALSKAGGVLYTPAEAYSYVTLGPRERRMIRELKAIKQGGKR